MALYGAILINLAIGLSIITIGLMIIYLRNGDYRLFLTGQRTALGISFLVFLATVTLVSNLLKSNFNIEYVVKYTSIETPVVYKLSALWAGQSGSLLFWLFILSVYTTIVVLQNRFRYHQLMPYVISVMATIQLFFLLLVNYVENPFTPVKAGITITDGSGLNPLLQNPTMAVHPPVLYLGYVGFAVPFAFAMAALFSNRLDALWVRSIRRWTLFTWLALGCGIILGGWWAYLELGWGGYWAWDPVENASFMPWLTGTAFVHSIIIQEKKNMLRIWNMVLIITTFVLAIFGTFLTRSGVVSSVHSFTQSSLGPMFVIFIGIIISVSTYFIIFRLKDLRSEKKLESFISRESGFLFNNVVFVSLCFAVFWGTLFPVISEAVRGSKVTVSAPFFNQIAIPIGIIMLLLTGIGPLLAWRRTSKKSMVRNFSIPVVIGLVVFLISFLFGIRSIYPLMTIALTGFVTGTIVLEFYRGIKVRTKKFGENPFTAIVRIVSKNRSRYGGYIVHFGIVLMFIGFVGKAFDMDNEWVLKTGDKVELAGYSFMLSDVSEAERPNHYAWIASLHVVKNSEYVTDLYPEKRIYFHNNPDPNRRQPHSEVDIYSTFKEDIYAVVGDIDTEENTISLKIMINRLIMLVWIGGYLLLIGTVIAFWPSKLGL